MAGRDGETLSPFTSLSKAKLNHNSTQSQPNITSVGLDTIMTLYTPSTTPHKLNVSNISAVTEENLQF